MKIKRIEKKLDKLIKQCSELTDEEIKVKLSEIRKLYDEDETPLDGSIIEEDITIETGE